MNRSTITFLRLFKILAACVLLRLKHSALPRVLNPIKHCCSVLKHHVNSLLCHLVSFIQCKMAKAYAVTIWTSIQNEELCHYVVSPKHKMASELKGTLKYEVSKLTKRNIYGLINKSCSF